MTVQVPAVAEVATALDKSVEAIQAAYDAEVADQAARCRVDPYNHALASALVRRVRRATAMEKHALGVIADLEAGATRLSSSDPEVRRLEGPYRKLVIG